MALPFFKSKSLLILNGDSFYETELRSFLDQHDGKCSNASLLLVEMSDTNHYGSVKVDANCMIKSFDEKITNGKHGWVNSGIYLIEEHMIQRIPPSKTVSLEHEMFSAWIGYEF